MTREELESIKTIFYIYIIFLVVYMFSGFLYPLPIIFPYYVALQYALDGFDVYALCPPYWNAVNTFLPYISLLFISISIVYLYNYKIKFSIISEIIACLSICVSLFIVVYDLYMNNSNCGDDRILGVFTLNIGFYLCLISLVGFCGIIVVLFRKRNLENIVKEIKFKEMAQKVDIDFDQKNRLFGMIKLEKRIDLGSVNEILGIPESKIKGILYDLAGEGKIFGEFRGNDFIITSNIDDFITALDASFEEWEYSSKEKKS